MSKLKKKSKNNSKFIFIFIAIIVAVFIIWGNNKKPNNEQNNNINNTSNNAISTQEENNNNTNTKDPSIVESLSEEEIKLSQKHGLPVLMYHFFYDAQAGETGRDNNYMEIHDFEEQIKYLSDNGYYVPTWDEVLGYIDGKNGLPSKSVVITVDDGAESFFRLAVPVLNKYNFKATSFAITSWYTIPETGDFRNVDFQSHSHDMHKPGSDGKGAFLTKSYDDACKDVQTSRSILGENCNVFCYPFGHYNDKCKQVLKDCNYILAFTTQGGRVYPGSDQFELPRVRMSKGESMNSFISKVK